MPRSSAKLKSEVQTWYKVFAGHVTAKRLSQLKSLLHDDFFVRAPDGTTGDKQDWLKRIATEFKRFDYPDVHVRVKKVWTEKNTVVVYLEKRLLSFSKRKARFDSIIQSREVLVRSSPLRLKEIDNISRDVRINGEPLGIREQRRSGALVQGCGNEMGSIA